MYNTDYLLKGGVIKLFLLLGMREPESLGTTAI